jgi:4-methyl-5(b-hydroxyethyl)-thiazole monophosphate biosynthesis
MPGAQHLAKSAALTQILLSQYKNKRPLGAICASPGVVLAPLGILKNKRATVFPADAFKGTYILA